MAYDAENRMTAESQTGFESVRYVYDGQGQRVEKCQSNTAGVCDPAGLQTVSVFDAFGNLAAEYNSGAAIAPPCTTCYLSTDQIGSTRLVTGPGGNVVSRHDYLAFGYDMGTNYGRVNTGLPNSVWGVADGVPEAYTGQVHDDETNFDWFRTRYYTRFQGRFHSPDPFNAGVDLTNPQSWNGYAYVNNNPLSNTDPWGLQDCPAPCSAYSNPGQSPGTPAAGGSGSGGGFTIWQSSNAPPRSMAVQSNQPVLESDLSRISKPQPQGTETCPAVPNGPGATTLNSNISFARNIGQAYSILDGPFLGFAAKFLWFRSMVKGRSLWDFKNQPYPHAHPEYADFGNFNFGATGNALGLPTSILLRGAGYAQSKAGTSTPSWGHWWGSAPYGDDPEDQQQIKNGIQYAQGECY